MNIGERITHIRKSLKMSQTQFGARIGVSFSAISQIEKGRNNASEQTLRMICSEYKVNYTWLTTGEGDMYLPSEDAERAKLEALLDRLDLTPNLRAAFLALVDMPPEFLVQLDEYLKKILSETHKDAP